MHHAYCCSTIKSWVAGAFCPQESRERSIGPMGRRRSPLFFAHDRRSPDHTTLAIFLSYNHRITMYATMLHDLCSSCGLVRRGVASRDSSAMSVPRTGGVGTLRWLVVHPVSAYHSRTLRTTSVTSVISMRQSSAIRNLPRGIAWTSAHQALKAENRAWTIGDSSVQEAARRVDDAETEANPAGVSVLGAGAGMFMVDLDEGTRVETRWTR